VPEVFQLKYSNVFLENILLSRFFCLLKRVKKLVSVQSFPVWIRKAYCLTDLKNLL